MDRQPSHLPTTLQVARGTKTGDHWWDSPGCVPYTQSKSFSPPTSIMVCSRRPKLPFYHFSPPSISSISACVQATFGRLVGKNSSNTCYQPSRISLNSCVQSKSFWCNECGGRYQHFMLRSWSQQAYSRQSPSFNIALMTNVLRLGPIPKYVVWGVPVPWVRGLVWAKKCTSQSLYLDISKFSRQKNFF